jgi:transcriptional regulator with XRE-family HTH domain
MTQAGLSASQLARQIWGTEKTRRGAAKNRDRVGAYMKGLAYPNPASLKKLADAIGIPVVELAPPARKRSPPKTVTLPAEGPLSINMLPAGQARLQIDRVMPLKLALEIAQQIDALGADTAAPEGSPRLGSVV